MRLFWNAMIKTILFSYGLILTFFGFSGESLLDIKVSVNITNTPVKNILVVIEEKGGVVFSYNPEVIDDKRIVSLYLKDQTIRFGLSLIFDETIRFKEVGKHIVLLKEEDREVIKARKKEHLTYTFRGQVLDAKTNEPIVGASIYDIESRFATISSKDGSFQLEIPHEEDIRSFYVKRKGYHEQVLVVDLNNATKFYKVSLKRELEDMERIETTGITKLPSTFEEKAISGIWVSDEAFLHGENLSEIADERVFQVSLVPSVSIGSNLSTNILITNKYSLNVLAGFSNGVNGAEVGGLVNIVKGRTRWCQIAGIGNINGGDVIGFQAGGITNMVTGNIYGVQAAGITNMNKQMVTGAQISGIANLNRGGFRGLQGAGLVNVAFDKSIGMQVAGFSNISKTELHGAQIAGFTNFTLDGTNYLQISSFFNQTRFNNGLQISGLINYSVFNNGLQVGLINVSKKSKGVSLGLINFVWEGYHAAELAVNELGFKELRLKSGTKHFHNIYTFGSDFSSTPNYKFGLGFGTYFNLGEHFKWSMDVTGGSYLEDNFDFNQSSTFGSFNTTLDVCIGKHIAIFAGPSFNVNVLFNEKAEGGYWSDFSFLPIASYDSPTTTTRMWVGAQFGVRIY